MCQMVKWKYDWNASIHLMTAVSLLFKWSPTVSIKARKTRYVSTTWPGCGTKSSTMTLRWRRSRAGPLWGRWRAASTTKWVSEEDFYHCSLFHSGKTPMDAFGPVNYWFQVSDGLVVVLSSEIREDKVPGDCFEECSGSVRLGAQTVSQIHGLQGKSPFTNELD